MANKFSMLASESLKERRWPIRTALTKVTASLEALSSHESSYAQAHIILIDAYTEVLSVYDEYLIKAKELNESN